MPIRLKITEAEITQEEGDFGIGPEVLEIRKLAIIDSNTGETLRIAHITPELLNLFLHIEIDVTDYMNVQEAIKSNPAFSKLVNTFSLVL